jgi:hypothetical protein
MSDPHFPPSSFHRRRTGGSSVGGLDLPERLLTSVVLALILYFGIKYRRLPAAAVMPTTNLKVELGWIFGLLFLGIGTYMWAAVVYFQMFSTAENP